MLGSEDSAALVRSAVWFGGAVDEGGEVFVDDGTVESVVGERVVGDSVGDDVGWVDGLGECCEVGRGWWSIDEREVLFDTGR